MLLMFDDCEYAVEPVAELVAALRVEPALRILVIEEPARR